MRIGGRKAIVTGASSGIGRATALELARHGCDLVLAARRPEQLEAVATACRTSGVICEVVPTDVSSREQCERLIERALERFGQIDILVNAAGFALLDRIEETDPEIFETLMKTNYLGTVWCSRAILPSMLARGSGAIVNLASITGLMGSAGMGAYGATKFAIVGFTEALRSEVIDRGVRVSMVCPGTTETDFFVTAAREKIPAASRLIRSLSAEEVAHAVRRAIERGSYRIILPPSAALYMRFKEILPRTAHLLMRTVSRWMERKA